MAGRSLILDCNNKIGEKVNICGWVQARRDHGKILFLDVLDRSGLIQAVTQSADLRPQDVVCITGTVKKRPENLVNKNIPTGEIEISAEKIEILSKAKELPFDMGGPELHLELPTLLDWRSLTLRHPKIKKIFETQANLVESFRKATQELGCTEIFVPTISYSSTEGGAEVFKFKYFDHQAFLIQSPQLYKQILVPVFERVSLLSHAYRAEPSVTTRHLAESVQLDVEMGLVEFTELMDAFEAIAKKMLNLQGQVPRITFKQAQEIILKRTKRDQSKELDLTPEDEKVLGKWVKEEHGSELLTVTHFYTKKRAFYTMPDPADPEYSLSYDLLYKGMEVLSGSQRIDEYDKLVMVIQERGMDPKDFQMYLQAFQFGMPPHGGFSFGLERLTMQFLDLANIRQASLFPRDMERVDVKLR
ncbi:aspartate--tRNA(Asn) ligase [Candidatus Daviesbacteria bacterium]|nr:aspartate--tRNA(Asn) ligase [Candidatus Daviesbacteria bacterium]